MNSPLISIIIPVYNTADYIEDCVNSILSQTYNNYEIILVDDGSKDNSGFLCDKISESYDKIIVLHKNNGGSSSARNKGLELANGKYVMFLDSDDYINDVFCFQSLVDKLNVVDYDFVLFKSLKGYISKDKFIDYYGDYNQKVFDNFDKNAIFSYMIKYNKLLACCWNKIIKKSILIENNIYFKEGIVGEDIDWIVRLFYFSDRIGMLNKVYHIYRQDNSSSITSVISQKKVNDLYNIIVDCVEFSKTCDAQFANIILSFMAFEYAILFNNITYFDNYNEFRYVVEYSWLLKYASDKKTKAVKFLFDLFGFNKTIKTIKSLRSFL